MSGKFIVIEGLDGSGKSTYTKLLGDFLKERGESVLVTYEPTNGKIGKEIRSVLRKEKQMCLKNLQVLYAKDREQHLKNEIEPALKKGKIVICDRYIFSSLAYGSIYTDIDFLKKLNEKFRLPDLTIFIDTKPEECMKRIDKREGKREIFEDIDKLKKIRTVYLSFAGRMTEYPNFEIIDGNREKEKVFEDIKNIVMEYLKRC